MVSASGYSVNEKAPRAQALDVISTLRLERKQSLIRVEVESRLLKSSRKQLLSLFHDLFIESIGEFVTIQGKLDPGNIKKNSIKENAR